LPKSSTVNDINTDLRPISLTPTISKIAEEYVVVNHVKPAVIKHIRPDQYGCIPQSSTTHDHSLLITKLKNYGINPYIINWICDFLMDRQQRVKMANDIYSEWKDVVAVVPQGTKLGPWLFLIMINDLEISSADGNVIFVNDITSFEIVEKDKSSSMQLTADEASAWSNVNMFQIQTKKCKELRISFKKNPGTYENITINGNTIDVVRSVKILGVTLQSNLKWNEHINNIVKKASKRLYFLSQLERAKVPSND
jgi:hypothetical protein